MSTRDSEHSPPQTAGIASGNAPGGAEPQPHASLLSQARALVRARIAPDTVSGGVSVIDHAEGVVAILADLGVDETAQAAAWLIRPAELWPVSAIARDFDPVLAHLVERMRQLIRLSAGGGFASAAQAQHEMLRRMLLAMADDIRVVLLLLASRLQTLRLHAKSGLTPDASLSRETLDVLAPLANRLGLWQLKWELEDLAFRFLEPSTYRSLAGRLEEKRAAREAFVKAAEAKVLAALAHQGVTARVSGRPKHLYSIHLKMQNKGRDLDTIQDLRGLRVIVESVAQCYQALAVVHGLWKPIESEYDDYIARPKANGYRSLHTVVVAEDGLPLEIQIRTADMHRSAEYGVASHWRYKEATRAGEVSPSVAVERNIDWVRQLLAWQREVGQAFGSASPDAAQPELAFIYALTPQGRVIELPAGSTAIDFAYHVHTGLGHRCRGARIDGQLIPLNRPLQTGQTVEIIAAKEGSAEGPSRDWLNPALGYVASPRARGKVRQWFNALELARDAASGRERVERVLQREGRTALSFEELARRLEQPDPMSMFVAVARDEIGPRQIEEAVRGVAEPAGTPTEPELLQRLARPGASGGAQRAGSVLVVGMDSLMNQLARCCRPLPPDPVTGYVTQGRGVSVHRSNCATLARLIRQAPERVIETSWDPRTLKPGGTTEQRRFPVEVELRAHDRQGLLRDVSEVFARDRMNVTAVNTLSRQQQALMRFTVEATDAAQLERTLVALRKIAGVTEARRRLG
jgi:GTP pyrophosphokinase